MGLNLKSGVDLSPAYLGEFAYVGWLGGQEAGMQEAELRSLWPIPHSTVTLKCSSRCPVLAQAASCPAAQSWAPAKNCHHWPEREGNTTGDTMVRGDVWDHPHPHRGTGRIMGEGNQGDLPLSAVCATKSDLPHYSQHKGQERSVRIPHWGSKACRSTVFFREFLISRIIR